MARERKYNFEKVNQFDYLGVTVNIHKSRRKGNRLNNSERKY